MSLIFNPWARWQFPHFTEHRAPPAKSAGHIVPVLRAKPIKRRVTRGMLDGYKFEARS